METYEMRVITVKDGEFRVDLATFSEKKLSWQTFDEEEMAISAPVYQSDTFAPISAFSINWPYVVFSGLSSKHIMIVNAFTQKTINRVQLHDEVDKICSTYITDTNDLFVLTQIDEIYRLYYLDLDAANIFENQDSTEGE